MTHWRMAVATVGVGLLTAAGVLALLPLRWSTTVPGARAPTRTTVACSSPWDRWTGHDYDRPADPASLTARSYESRLLAVEAGESGCLLQSGSHEELCTILALLGVVALAAPAVRRRRGVASGGTGLPVGSRLHVRTRRAT